MIAAELELLKAALQTERCTMARQEILRRLYHIDRQSEEQPQRDRRSA